MNFYLCFCCYLRINYRRKCPRFNDRESLQENYFFYILQLVLLRPSAACPPGWKIFVNVVRLVLAATYAVACGVLGAVLLHVSLVTGAWNIGPAVLLSGMVLVAVAVLGLLEFVILFLITFFLPGKVNENELVVV